jgi:pimeloyl-ACP methyl ester carboxylesterase
VTGTRAVAALFATVALAYLAVCVLLFVFQRNLIWMPQPALPGGGASSLTLDREGVRLRITTHPADGPDALLYFGGNAEAVAGSLPELRQAFPGHALYLMNYRGYGGSGGRPSEAAVVADALALYDLVQERHRNVSVMGRSLGSGVAVQVAAARPVARLVLVTPFASLRELAARQFPFVPVRWLLRDPFESGAHAGRVRAPTLVLVAEHDEVIPRASTDALLERFPPGLASLAVLPGTSHNTVSWPDEYVRLIRTR